MAGRWRPPVRMRMPDHSGKPQWVQNYIGGGRFGSPPPQLIEWWKSHKSSPRPYNWEIPFGSFPLPAAPPVPAGVTPGQPAPKQQLWGQTLTPEYGLQGNTPQQLGQIMKQMREQRMSASGVTVTANGLWSVREQRYLTPGEAAAFG